MYEPYHQIHDEVKYQVLVESMTRHGWQGMPLVADGDCLLTGSHRYPAATAAGVEPEVVDIRDIYPEWDSLHESFGAPTIDEHAYLLAVLALPVEIREHYGIDLH